jgi:hypothetical protein
LPRSLLIAAAPRPQVNRARPHRGIERARGADLLKGAYQAPTPASNTRRHFLNQAHRVLVDRILVDRAKGLGTTDLGKKLKRVERELEVG